MPQIIFDKDTSNFVWMGSYQEREEPKSAGFNWNKPKKRWETAQPDVAAKLFKYMTMQTQVELKKQIKAQAARYSDSLVETANIDIPKPPTLQEDFFPFQKAAINISLARKHIMIADPTGVGKTITGTGIINAVKASKVLIVCPASVKNNWVKELNKWLWPNDVTIHKITAQGGWPKPVGERNIYVINYDILDRHTARLKEHWDVFIADEAHYLKSGKSHRSVAVYENILDADYVAFLSATPLKNHPIELWPQLLYLDPKTWTYPNGSSKFFYYAKEYCGGFYNKYGFVAKGVVDTPEGKQKLNELEKVLRQTVMIRREKKVLLPELPPKFRRIIEIPIDKNVAIQLSHEQEMWQDAVTTYGSLKEAVTQAKTLGDEEAYRECVKNLTEGLLGISNNINQERQKTAILKAPYAVAFMQDLIEGGEDKVVFFAHHRKLLEIVKAELGKTAVIFYGGMSEKQKQKALDAFKDDPAIHTFCGSILAAGLGLNELVQSGACQGVFGELTYVPTDMSQAEDRLSRHGQKNNVTWNQMVFPGSIDARLAKILVLKQARIDNVLDSQHAEMPIDAGKPILTQMLEEDWKKIKEKN